MEENKNNFLLGMLSASKAMKKLKITGMVQPMNNYTKREGVVELVVQENV